MTDYELTRQDINALRKADSVSFHYNARKIQDGDRSSFIRAHKRPTYEELERDPFAREMEHTIDLGDGPGRHTVVAHAESCDAYNAYESVMTAQHDREWQTVARSLKVGESIRMHWTRDNNSEIIRKAGLHVDSLTIAVGVEGKTARWYHISTRICEDNTARMIQGLR